MKLNAKASLGTSESQPKSNAKASPVQPQRNMASIQHVPVPSTHGSKPRSRALSSAYQSIDPSSPARFGSRGEERAWSDVRFKQILALEDREQLDQQDCFIPQRSSPTA